MNFFENDRGGIQLSEEVGRSLERWLKIKEK